MIQRYNKILILLLVVFAVSNAFAQQIKGVVTDSVTHEPLMYISVYYQDKREMGTVTNIDGEYKKFTSTPINACGISCFIVAIF